MKTNKKMRDLLKRIDLKTIDAVAILPNDLQKLANSGFLETELGVVLRGLDDQGRFVQLEDFPDKTGYECFVNKFHVNDYFETVASEQGLLEHAIAFAFILRENLLNEFHERHFEIIISINQRTCVICFHTIRRNENWLAQNIESYETEGVLAITV